MRSTMLDRGLTTHPKGALLTGPSRGVSPRPKARDSFAAAAPACRPWLGGTGIGPMPMASCGWTRPCPSARPDSPVRCSTSSCEISIPADKPCWFMRPLRCTSSAWLGLIVFSEFLDRRLKVCCGHAELFVVLALLFMNQVGNGQHRRPLAQEGDVGPDQPFRNACQHAKIHVAAQRPPVGV